MSGLKHVSTFSGVGGIDLAFERAGIPTIATAEFDKRARGVLADHNPVAHQFHDVKDVTADALYELGLDPRRTVLSGGFPCQDLSVAGARRGLGDGTRSGLYWELDRIMGEFRPAWVVFENVPGILSAACACPGDSTCVERGLARACAGDTHSVPGGACWGECIARHGGVMGAVLGSLAERGYGFAYRVLDAQHFGVPQRRRRVVIVGRLGDSGAAPAQVLLEPEGVPGNPAAGIAPRPVAAGSSRAGAEASGVLGDVAHTLTAEGHDASEDGTGRGTPVVTYAPSHAATLTAGTSRPGVSAPGRRQEDDVNVVAFHHMQDPISGDQSPAIGAKSSGMGVAYVADKTTALDTAQGGPDDNAAQGGHLVATYQKVIRSGARGADGSLPPEVWERRDVAATLNLNDLGSEGRAVDLVVTPLAVRGRDGGAQIELGDPDGPYNALRAGDGGSSRQSLVMIEERDQVLAPTLTASLGEGGWAGHNRKDEMVERTFEAGATVRRLTPTECERLQGFPDGHTLTSNGTPQSDAQRYKQMGNAVAVPVFEWVARRIAAVDATPSGGAA